MEKSHGPNYLVKSADIEVGAGGRMNELLAPRQYQAAISSYSPLTHSNIFILIEQAILRTSSIKSESINICSHCMPKVWQQQQVLSI